MTAKEEVRKILSESELFIGMFVEYTGCDKCGGAHRFILTSEAGPCPFSPAHTRTWEMVLSPHAPFNLCAFSAISQGRLYEVKTGLDREADYFAGQIMTGGIPAPQKRPAPAKKGA